LGIISFIILSALGLKCYDELSNKAFIIIIIIMIKEFRLSRAVAVRKIFTSPTASALSARKLKFWLPESFRPT
jgi:hypothetical protein